MPIGDQHLNRSIYAYEAAALLEPVVARFTASPQAYLVVCLPEERFAALEWSEVEAALQTFTRLSDRTAFLNASLGELFASLGAEGAEQDALELYQAEQLRQSSPTGTLVVLAGGAPVGVLAEAARPGPVVSRSFDTGERTLRGEGSQLPASADPEKKVHVLLFDENYNRVQPDQSPLQAASAYTLELKITEKEVSDSLVKSALLRYRWKDGESEVTLTARLESDDFDILSGSQTLRLPRQGDSTKARFDLRTRRAGPAVLNILFFKGEVFLQLLTMKFTVVEGGLYSERSSGRSLAAAFHVQPRSLSLTILQSEGGFQLVMAGAVAATARVSLSREQLAYQVEAARKEMQEKVVYHRDPATNKRVYQNQVSIPTASRDQTLRHLAIAGYRLYREIFYHAGSDPQLNRLGDALRHMAQQEGLLQIQIFSQHFMLPWGLLYLASEDTFDPSDVHPDWFLGLRHIIEHIPLQQSMHVTEAAMDSRAGLEISLSFNHDIDAQMQAPYVASQVAFWDQVAQTTSAHLAQRHTAGEVLQALRQPAQLKDQVLYFYCHAVSRGLEEAAQGGPDASHFVLSGGETLTLKDLKLYAPHTRLLPGEPLVFINACESTTLSPLFYDGFVPYFLSKGARGVIGAECELPAVFAVEWAKRFFNRFLQGQPVGQIALDLRREFFFTENNILGLLYGLYVDADTRLAPALIAPPANP